VISAYQVTPAVFKLQPKFGSTTQPTEQPLVSSVSVTPPISDKKALQALITSLVSEAIAARVFKSYHDSGATFSTYGVVDFLGKNADGGYSKGKEGITCRLVKQHAITLPQRLLDAGILQKDPADQYNPNLYRYKNALVEVLYCGI
jgi:hypothetical protein